MEIKKTIKQCDYQITLSQSEFEFLLKILQDGVEHPVEKKRLFGEILFKDEWEERNKRHDFIRQIRYLVDRGY